MSLSSDGTMLTMPVAPANTGNGNGFGWGGDGAWWIVLFLIFAAFGGWGNGFGFGGGGNGVMDGYVLTSDFANVARKIDSVNQGLCDGFYQQAQLVNGTNMAMANGFAQAELSRSNQQAALMQQLNAMQMQAANCCCENRAAIAQVRYDMATQACDTRNTVQNTTRDIIDAMNCGFRSIDQRLTAQEIAAKDAKIAEQNQRLFAADLAASQSAQTLDMRNYVSAQFAYYNPRPVPSFSVPAPYQYTGCGNQYNCNGCGC
jgi:hypothetical protein|nr:MAG TPA_asm: hypothetical protein [Caudoviricetes sp.]